MKIYRDDTLIISVGYYKCTVCGAEFYGNGPAIHNEGCSEKGKRNGYEKCDYYVGPQCKDYQYAEVEGSMKRFNIRIDDLEIRTCNDYLGLNGNHTKAEIIKWQQGQEGKETYYAIAVYCPTKEGKEGFDLSFVGDRPFGEDINQGLFMRLAKQGQQLLDEAIAEQVVAPEQNRPA